MLNKHAQALAKLAHASRTPQERTELAKKAAQARWHKHREEFMTEERSGHSILLRAMEHVANDQPVPVTQIERISRAMTLGILQHVARMVTTRVTKRVEHAA